MNRQGTGRKALSPVLFGVTAEIAFAAALGVVGILICAAAIWIAGMV
jgi:hypothetical protein